MTAAVPSWTSDLRESSEQDRAGSVIVTALQAAKIRSVGEILACTASTSAGGPRNREIRQRGGQTWLAQGELSEDAYAAYHSVRNCHQRLCCANNAEGVSMEDSRFWRLIAVLGVAGIFYVGHGLHTEPLPSIDSPAMAAAPWGQHGHSDFFTVNEDGSVLYRWRSFGGQVKFDGLTRAEARADDEKIAP